MATVLSVFVSCASTTGDLQLASRIGAWKEDHALRRDALLLGLRRGANSGLTMSFEVMLTSVQGKALESSTNQTTQMLQVHDYRVVAN